LAKTLSAITQPARFEAAMGERPCARSAHFSVHYLRPAKLSTVSSARADTPVDDSVNPQEDGTLPGAVKLGMVVPKRHARRSVTRSLIKHQVRANVRARLVDLPAGEWVVRLRAPIDRKTYPSAASEALASVVRDELMGLLADAERRVRGRAGDRSGSARAIPGTISQ